MPRVLVRCPLTRQPVFTGLVMTVQAFDETPPVPQLFLCASCGQRHSWKAGAAYLEADQSA